MKDSMPEVTASGATHAARESFDKSLNVIVEILVPVGAAVGGFFLPAVLGGGQSVANVAYHGLGDSGSGNTANRIGWAVQALINGAVGGAFWHMRNGGGIIMKAIGGAVGGFFLGGALGCLPGLFNPNQPPNGLIDSLAGSIQTIAKGG